MAVTELEQAAYTIITVSPALGVAMKSLAAKTAASSLPALVTSNITAYEAATGATGFAATVVSGTAIATTGEIVLTAAAVVAIGAFLVWLIDHLGIKQGEETEIFNETFIKIGNAKGILFPGSTTKILAATPRPDITKFVKAFGQEIPYLPIDLVSNAFSCIYNPLSTTVARWTCSEDTRIIGENKQWQYTESGESIIISSNGTVPQDKDSQVFIQFYTVEGVIGIAVYVRHIGKKLYYRNRSGQYILVGDLPDGYYYALLPAAPTNIDPNGVYTNWSGNSYLFPGNPRLDPNSPISTGGTSIINAEIADRGLWKIPPMIQGDKAVITVPVIAGATDINSLDDLTTETIDNVSENVLDGNISPETVTEPTIQYAPATPVISVPSIDIPPAIDSPTFTPDNVPAPPLPVISAVSSQFVKLYNPTPAEVGTLSSFMLSSGFVDNVLKLFANPADYVLDLSIIPTGVTTTAEKEPVHIGNVAVPDLTMYRVTEQYITKDLGTITIDPAYRDFVDYQTRAFIFLPYIGERELNIDDVMGATLHLTYNIDVLTGACAALLHVNNPNAHTPIDAVLYQWDGNVMTHIPITSSQWSTSIGQIATAVGAMVTGGVAGIATAGTILATAGLSPRISTSGNLSSNAGLLGVQTPYVVLSIPRVATPSNYSTYSGRSTSRVDKLGNLSGMVVVEDVHVEGLPATSDEIEEVETLLREGVQL